MTYDLTGLPPTPAEVRAFLEDRQPRARERVVDRLLASPRYGERWGRHWLDVARYGDSLGYRYDDPIPYAWQYRDFVIRSLNRDLPFDDFVRWQVAGDEIAPGDREALAATGFCAVGPRPRFEGNDLNRKEARYIEIDDIVSTTFAAFLGLSMDCARCHDHKHDPISQREYYSVAKAFLSGTREEQPYLTGNERKIWSDWSRRSDEAGAGEEAWRKRNKDAVEAVAAEMRPRLEEEKAALVERCLVELEKTNPGIREKVPVDRLLAQHALTILGKTGHKRLSELRRKLKSLEDHAARNGEALQRHLPAAAYVEWLALTKQRQEVLKDRPLGPEKCAAYVEKTREPVSSPVMGRGSVAVPGEEVPLSFLEVLMAAPVERWTVTGPGNKTYQRSALANWLTDVERGAGGLLARVAANRLWYHHFGEGLVRTPNDFGTEGDRPALPELLDYLACELVEGGWSLKKMHRRLVLSATYGQSAEAGEEGKAKDPGNETWWRWRPRRAEAEVLRDSVLAVSGRLNERRYGPPSYLPVPKEEILTRVGKPYPTNIKDGPPVWRRSVYAFVRRTVPVPLLQTFDAPDASTSCGRRVATTVAPQALSWLNDDFVRRRSRDFSARIWRECEDSDGARVQRAFELALCRPATEEEERAAIAFIHAQVGRREGNLEGAWEDFCQGLFGLNEFSYFE